MSMGLRLRQVRMRAGFSLRNLAILLGVSHSTIGHWEAGRRVPNALMLGKFATVTGVDLNWLFSVIAITLLMLMKCRDRS